MMVNTHDLMVSRHNQTVSDHVGVKEQIITADCLVLGDLDQFGLDQVTCLILAHQKQNGLPSYDVLQLNYKDCYPFEQMQLIKNWQLVNWGQYDSIEKSLSTCAANV